MLKKILLISSTEIKNATIIQSNVDDKLLSKVIQNTQEISLRPILGNDKYDELLNEVYSATTQAGYLITTDNLTLLEDYIQPYLEHAVVNDYLIMSTYNMSNKGLTKSDTSVSLDDMETSSDYYKNYTAIYKKRLIDYIKSLSTPTKKTDEDYTSDSVGWFL